MDIKSIITHPGGAHKDDLLACSLLLAKSPVRIERREPTQQDLEDPTVAIVDVGHEHAPERENFDHHQFPRDHEPTCSLSLVLKHLGLYEDAKKFCAWLEPAEWFDCRGAVKTAKMLGVERDIIGKLNSPIDITLLRRFALTSTLNQGEPLWEILRMIGEDLIDYLQNLRHRIDFIEENSQLWTLPNSTFKILFLPRTEPLPEEPSGGLGQYITEKGLEETVIGTVYPDRRNTGYGISRYNDNPLLDFTQVEGEPDIHFAHKSGFMAKTTATDPKRLEQLIGQAMV